MPPLPLNPLNLTGGNAGPSEVRSTNTFSFNTGAFGAEPASNQLIKAIVPVAAVGMAGLILWLVLK
tara:strand:- start:4937 stop:5134 length:198 start_codon:yes stop_codon:yes gene_type:complete